MTAQHPCATCTAATTHRSGQCWRCRRPGNEDDVPLTGGQWINDHGIQRWAYDIPPAPEVIKTGACLDCLVDVARTRLRCQPCATRAQRTIRRRYMQDQRRQGSAA